MTASWALFAVVALQSFANLKPHKTIQILNRGDRQNLSIADLQTAQPVVRAQKSPPVVMGVAVALEANQVSRDIRLGRGRTRSIAVAMELYRTARRTLSVLE
jgi:hypothetical protein